MAETAATDPLVFQLAIFILAALLGACLVRPASPSHRLSWLVVATAISAIVVVGALLSVGVDASIAGEDGPLWARLFGFVAVILASAGAFGGFALARRLVTQGAAGS